MEKRIPTLDEFIVESDESAKETMKKMILDYCESLGGKASWKQLHDFILDAKGLPKDASTRGQFASYFSGHSTTMAKLYRTPGKNRDSHGLLEIPSKNDPRYLEKDENGMWTLKTA